VADSTCNIAVLISGGGSNLQSIIDHIQAGHIHAKINCVISNKAQAYGLQRAKSANIPTHIIEHINFSSREAFDAELLKIIKVNNIDLIILAGFMRILSKTFIDQCDANIVNIHPSLLPKFPGLHTHQRAIDANETEHGCSVHFVSDELDSGPLILQAKVKVNKTDTAETLASRVLEKEHIIYPLVAKWYSEKRLKQKDEHAYFDNKRLDKAILLTTEHQAELQ